MSNEMNTQEEKKVLTQKDLNKAMFRWYMSAEMPLNFENMQGYAILVREEFSCLEFIMNRDTINWILKKLNTGGRIWSIYQRKSIKTASATRW